jgi:hemoglobin
MVRPYEVGITGPAREKMWGRLVIAARHMINTKEEDHNQE